MSFIIERRGCKYARASFIVFLYACQSTCWVQLESCSFLKLKRIVLKPEEDQPRCTSISNIIAVFENPLHFVTYIQSLLPSAPFIKFIQLPCYPAVCDTTIPYLSSSNFVQGSSEKCDFFVICALNICLISTHLAMSNGPPSLWEKNLALHHDGNILCLFRFSPPCCQAGPAWAKFLGTLGRH